MIEWPHAVYGNNPAVLETHKIEGPRNSVMPPGPCGYQRGRGPEVIPKGPAQDPAAQASTKTRNEVWSNVLPSDGIGPELDDGTCQVVSSSATTGEFLTASTA